MWELKNILLKYSWVKEAIKNAIIDSSRKQEEQEYCKYN